MELSWQLFLGFLFYISIPFLIILFVIVCSEIDEHYKSRH